MSTSDHPAGPEHLPQRASEHGPPCPSATEGASGGEADTNVRAPKFQLLKQRRVYETVVQKRHWAGPAEPAEAAVEEAIGSKGWHTRGYLPHFDQPGALQMVTFRLADAMPASRRHEWEALLAIDDERERRTELEAYLDRGGGECRLKIPAVAAAVEEALLRFDGERYRMAAWVVMPNHVHLLFELWTVPLGRLVKAWKGVSAHALNGLLGIKGTVWQADYWDRYLRDEAYFRKARHYIEWNPVKAGLVREPEAWVFSSANPKWRWTSPDRYAGGRLLNPPVAPAASQAPEERDWECGSERGHSCPLVPLGASTGGADKNVRAPMGVDGGWADKNVRAPGKRVGSGRADKDVRAPMGVDGGWADRNVRAPEDL